MSVSFAGHKMSEESFGYAARSVLAGPARLGHPGVPAYLVSSEPESVCSLMGWMSSVGREVGGVFT